MTPEIETMIRTEYEQLKPEIVRTVSSKLAGDGVRPLEDDIDYAYNEAWHALYMKMASGEEVENRAGFLVTVTHRRALNEFRAWHPSRRVGSGEVEGYAAAGDVDSRIDAADQLRQFREGLRSRLTAREQQAATLCYLHGLSRPEAARVMGVSPKRMEKIMDGASGRIQSLIGEIKAGEFCEGMDSTIRAYAVGLLEPDGERHQLAREHLDHCSGCRRQVLVLRGFGAVLPPAPAVFLLVGGFGAGGSGAAGVAGATGASGAAGGSGTGSGSAGGAAGSGSAGSGAGGTGAGGAGAGGTGGAAAGGAAAGASGGLLGTGGLIAAGVGALAVAGIAVGALTGVIGGGSSDDSPPQGTATAAAAAARADARAEARAERRAARAQARRRAAARRAEQRRAERRRARREAAQAAAAAAAAAAAVEAPPVEPAPAPVEPTPPPVESDPGTGGSEPAPSPPPQRDAAVEFELR